MIRQYAAKQQRRRNGDVLQGIPCREYPSMQFQRNRFPQHGREKGIHHHRQTVCAKCRNGPDRNGNGQTLHNVAGADQRNRKQQDHSQKRLVIAQIAHALQAGGRFVLRIGPQNQRVVGHGRSQFRDGLRAPQKQKIPEFLYSFLHSGFAPCYCFDHNKQRKTQCGRSAPLSGKPLRERIVQIRSCAEPGHLRPKGFPGWKASCRFHLR